MSYHTDDKNSIGLGNVDNTSDVNKPVSTAQATSIATKEPMITIGTTSQYWRGDKSWQTLNSASVGLSNVNNTSDSSKPVSTAQAAAIALKLTIPTGTILQYIRGDGSLGTTPIIPTNVSSFTNDAGYITSSAIPASLYSTYQANVTQSTTSAPVATQLANSFSGGVTFTWTRTGAGVYTLTASSAVFTTNKTKVFFGPLNNALGYVNYSITSTTIITVMTTITSILSLALTTGSVDSMMTNTPIDVRVYP